MRKPMLRAISALNTWIYRRSGGRLMGRFPSGAPVCLLTTIGRHSGRPRTVPLLYLQDRADYIVVASQGGAPQHPAWFLNLQANPAGEVQIGRWRLSVTALPVDEAERARLWPRLVALYPPYARYQQRTARRIPLVRLVPLEPARPAGQAV